MYIIMYIYIYDANKCDQTTKFKIVIIEIKMHDMQIVSFRSINYNLCKNILERICLFIPIIKL